MADPQASPLSQTPVRVPATLDDVVAALAVQQALLIEILAAVTKPAPLPPNPPTQARAR